MNAPVVFRAIRAEGIVKQPFVGRARINRADEIVMIAPQHVVRDRRDQRRRLPGGRRARDRMSVTGMSVASGAIVAGGRVGVAATLNCSVTSPVLLPSSAGESGVDCLLSDQRRRDEIRRRDRDRRQRCAVAAKALLKNLFPGIGRFGRLCPASARSRAELDAGREFSIDQHAEHSHRDHHQHKCRDTSA